MNRIARVATGSLMVISGLAGLKYGGDMISESLNNGLFNNSSTAPVIESSHDMEDFTIGSVAAVAGALLTAGGVVVVSKLKT